MIDVLKFVPVGAGNAKTARAIWRLADCWSQFATKRRLDKLADEGLINRRSDPLPAPLMCVYLYWRASDPEPHA